MENNTSPFKIRPKYTCYSLVTSVSNCDTATRRPVNTTWLLHKGLQTAPVVTGYQHRHYYLHYFITILALHYLSHPRRASSEPHSEDAPHPPSTPAAGEHISCAHTIRSSCTDCSALSCSGLHRRLFLLKEVTALQVRGLSFAVKHQALNPGAQRKTKDRHNPAGDKDVFPSPNSCYSIRRMHPLMLHWTVSDAPRKTLKKHSI